MTDDELAAALAKYVGDAEPDQARAKPSCGVH